ncbi:MAG: aminodeoxychorismate lyase [Chlorobi bacterium]|nr:aminodeoxychorismate lyase [Chlorobiota bacterium]
MVRKIILAIVILILAVGGYFVYQTWMRSDAGGDIIVRIPEGASFDEVLDSLEGAELIHGRAAFKILAVTTGNDGKIKPGSYKFNHGLSNAQLLSALVEGHSTVKSKVTFPEGITIRRIASIAAREAGCDSAQIVHLANDRAFLKTIGITAASAEGYLMPDTYYIFWGEKPATLLRRMADVFREFYTDALKKKAEALGLSSYEAITLASIVEGEARVDEERPVIAGVYLNRLHIGMKLQADPTIQYILPDGPRRLLFADTRLDNPYNTYFYKGLPPGPINNPGRASILATLSPATHDYLFFVAKADGSGRHAFSRTDREHDVAVRQYQANRSKP